MVYFLNIKVKTHAEDSIQSLFDENYETNLILGDFPYCPNRFKMVQRSF